jgi:hypothetical protein
MTALPANDPINLKSERRFMDVAEASVMVVRSYIPDRYSSAV